MLKMVVNGSGLISLAIQDWTVLPNIVSN